MADKFLELTLPMGRLVQGHPMELNPVKDDNTGQVKLDSTGQPRNRVFLAVAIPKEGSTDWKQTAWGSQILQRAQQDWPAGEWQRPDFHFKVEDGDSQIPNRNQKRNCDREGFPGCWIVKASSELGVVRCFPNGQYDPMHVIQDANVIKRGDYGRLAITVKGNGPSQSPGLYINPTMFSHDFPGEPILGDGPDPNAAFGGAAQQAPAGAFTGQQPAAPAQPATQAPPVQQPVAPAHDMLNGPGNAGAAPPPPVQQPAAPVEQFSVQGNVYTREQLLGFGWTDEQINAQQRV